MNMFQINRNQAEEIFNKSEVINTKIDQSENNICLIFDFLNGKHMEMQYKYPAGEKTYFIFNEPDST